MSQRAQQLAIDHGFIAHQLVEVLDVGQDFLELFAGRHAELLEHLRSDARLVGLGDRLSLEAVGPPQPPERHRQPLDHHFFDHAARLIVVQKPVEQRGELSRVFVRMIRQHDPPGQQSVLDRVAAGPRLAPRRPRPGRFAGVLAVGFDLVR